MKKYLVAILVMVGASQAMASSWSCSGYCSFYLIGEKKSYSAPANLIVVSKLNPAVALEGLLALCQYQAYEKMSAEKDEKYQLREIQITVPLVTNTAGHITFVPVTLQNACIRD